MSKQLTIGTLLHGKTYKILEVLGQGTFGITYLAMHLSLERKVAIKEFYMKKFNYRASNGTVSGMADGSLPFNYCRKFRKEALNLSQMDHPNIVRVTDSFKEYGTFYYVMDYIEGQDLNEYIKTHKVTDDEAIAMITEVAKALKYMHNEKHMLHLDLKPGNVMRRDSDGRIILIDFGLSKHYSKDGRPETSTTIGLGTPGYAPIEQSNQAKNGEFRPTIDVYALGATLYKLLTGETPPIASIIVSNEDIIAEKLRERGVKEKIVLAIKNSMLPSVVKRTQTVDDFIAALQDKAKKVEPTVVDVTYSGPVERKSAAVRPVQRTAAKKYVKKPIKTKTQTKDDEGMPLWMTCGIAFISMLILVLIYLFASGGLNKNKGNHAVEDSTAVVTNVNKIR